MAPGICLTTYRFLIKHYTDFAYHTSQNIALRSFPVMTFNVNNAWKLNQQQYGKSFSTRSTKITSHNVNSGVVAIEYINGFPYFTLPLPSRNEKCRFLLKPVSHTVGDFIEMLKVEDRGIDRATILNKAGVRIASSSSIESLLDEPFWIHINDEKYEVIPPYREKLKVNDLNKMGDIRALIGQLYEAFNVGEYNLHKEQELVIRLENLKYKLAPLEKEKIALSEQAKRKTNLMNWLGLGLMSVQFGILARLTWWEYSWDIMEPVTYFVTYGTGMAMYAYYCITRIEYNMPDVNKRQYLLTVYKSAKKKNFDVDAYNNLRREIAEIEYDLRRLRDPLNVQLPTQTNRLKQNPALNSEHKTKTSQVFNATTVN